MFARWLHGGVRLCAGGGIGRGQREHAHRGVHPRHQGMYKKVNILAIARTTFIIVVAFPG